MSRNEWKLTFERRVLEARKRYQFSNPRYADRTLYLTSESYGGHYLPTLARELQRRGTPNFGGFAVGNPMTYLKYRDFGQFGTWAAHQLLPKPEWDAYLANECAADCPPEDPTCRPNATCAALEARFSDYVSAADPYGLDFPVCADPSRAAGRRERHHVLRMAASVRGDAFRAYEPCASNYAADYVNDAAVRAALHVEAAAPRWEECSDAVASAYNFTDAAQPMMPVYADIIRRKPRVKILVYSGDDDSVCATLGSQQWIWDLGFEVVDAWKPWLLDGQLGGYRVSFDGFEFKTIHGAGHMCPATQPARTFDVLRTFLSEESP